MRKQEKNKLDGVKKYLKSYALIRSEKINLIAERRQIVYDVALPGAIDYSADRVQTSPEDQMLNKYLKIESRTSEIDRRLGSIEQKMNTMRYQINTLPDAIAKRLLHAKYIDNEGWDVITAEMNELFHIDNEEYVRGKLHDGSIKVFYQKWYTKVYKSTQISNSNQNIE